MRLSFLNPWRGRSLRTQLQLTMLVLLALSAAMLFELHLYSERALLARIREYTEELSTAIQIAQQQPGNAGDLQRAVHDYADRLRQLGVKDVSIADDTADVVQASTNPHIVGRKLVRKHGPKEYVVRGVLGDEGGSGHTTSSLTVPIVVGDRRVGYLVITRILDDFSLLSASALANRLAATLAVFGLGMLASIFLADAVSRPVRDLTQAARRVAAGDLEARVPAAGSGELDALASTFNTMVERLHESRALEERLHLAERTTSLGRLAAALAHEIRNPLNSINLAIDHVRGQLAPPEGARRAEFDGIMKMMQSEVARLNRLVADFLSFGQPARLALRSCDVGDTLQATLALVEHKARDLGVRVESSLAPNLPATLADPELLKTCFVNLALNALEAMPQGGRLRLTLDLDRLARVPTLVASVCDSGVGMTPEASARACEPYFSTKEAGMGLGLALVRSIVEGHAGSLEIDSAPGQGTRVHVRLPVREPHTAREARA